MVTLWCWWKQSRKRDSKAIIEWLKCWRRLIHKDLSPPKEIPEWQLHVGCERKKRNHQIWRKHNPEAKGKPDGTVSQKPEEEDILGRKSLTLLSADMGWKSLLIEQLRSQYWRWWLHTVQEWVWETAEWHFYLVWMGFKRISDFSWTPFGHLWESGPFHSRQVFAYRKLSTYKLITCFWKCSVSTFKRLCYLGN